MFLFPHGNNNKNGKFLQRPVNLRQLTINTLYLYRLRHFTTHNRQMLRACENREDVDVEKKSQAKLNPGAAARFDVDISLLIIKFAWNYRVRNTNPAREKTEFVQWEIIKGENFLQKVEEHSNALAKLKRTWIEKKPAKLSYDMYSEICGALFSSLDFPLFIFSSAACACVSPRSIYKWIRAIKWMDEWNASAFFLKNSAVFFCASTLCFTLMQSLWSLL